MWVDPPLYLHFLDRELSRSIGASPLPQLVHDVLHVLLFGTSARLYCGVSLVWESEHLAPDTLALCGTLIADDLLDLVSHHPTLGEFLDSRRILYAHDSHRYPKYFDATVPRPFLPLVPTIYKEASTTRALAKLLRGWCSTVHLHDEPHRKLASEILWTGMEERTIQALTYSVFDPLVPRTTEGRGAAHAVRRAISEGYASHYMEFLRGGAFPRGLGIFRTTTHSLGTFLYLTSPSFRLSSPRLG
jgi:hypothetical protein